MFSEKLARLVSIILGPFVWPVVIIFAVFTKAQLAPDQLKSLLPMILFLEVLVPVGYLLIGPKLGWVSSWDARSLKERGHFLFLVFGTTLISLYFVHLFGNKLLFDMGTVMIVYLAAFFVVNHFWRISFHAGLNTVASILINYLFDWKLFWLFLSIPAVFWARLELKKHSVAQISAGILLSAILALGGLLFFGYV